jgi:hypothetical protein
MQAVQRATNGVEFSFNQDGIASMQISAIDQHISQFFVFGKFLKLFSRRAKLRQTRKQVIFAGLEGFKAV